MQDDQFPFSDYVKNFCFPITDDEERHLGINLVNKNTKLVYTVMLTNTELKKGTKLEVL